MSVKYKLPAQQPVLLEEKNNPPQARTKLYHDASVSKWKHKTFWWVFFGGLFGGICGLISLLSELNLIHLPNFQVQQTTSIELPKISTVQESPQTVHSDSAKYLLQIGTPRTDMHDTLIKTK